MTIWPEDINEVDQMLFDGERLPAIAKFRELAGCSLSDAIDLVGARFAHLVAASPTLFRVSIANYWDHFYS